MKTIALVILGTIPFFLSCGSTLKQDGVTNITRLFWHEGTKYSAHVRESGQIKVVTLPHNMCTTFGDKPQLEPKLIPDVPLGALMWVRYVTKSSWSETCLTILEIHIHNEKDVEGAGWNHGKFGGGQTAVVQ